MKKTIIFVTIVILFLTFASCSKQKYINDSFAVVYEGDTPYLINQNLETYSLEAYDDIVENFGKYLTVAKNKKGTKLYGYIENTGKEIIKPQYHYASIFSEDKAIVAKNNVYKVIDSKNNVLYTFPDNIFPTSIFKEGFIVVEVDGKYQYMNESFELLPGKYDYAGSYTNDYALIGNFDDNQKLIYNYLKKDNTKLFSDDFLKDYTDADNFYDGYARLSIKQTPNVWDKLLKIAENVTPQEDNTIYFGWRNDLRIYNYTSEKSSLFCNVNALLEVYLSTHQDEYVEEARPYFTIEEDIVKWRYNNEGEWKDLISSSTIFSLLNAKVLKIETLNNELIITFTNHTTTYRYGETNYYSFINTQGEILTDTNNQSLFINASRFSDGYALTLIDVPNSYGYFRSLYINTEGQYNIKNSFTDLTMTRYIFTDLCANAIALKENDAGAGSWSLLSIDDTNDLVIKDLTIPEAFSEYKTNYYNEPYQMTAFKRSSFYKSDTDIALSRVHIFHTNEVDYYGLIDSNGVYVLNAIYSYIFY